MQSRWIAILALAALGGGLGIVAGCSGGSLESRQNRLAGTYDGTSFTLVVTASGQATGTQTLSPSGTRVLTGLVGASGSLSLTGGGGSMQGTLTESGGTLSLLVDGARTEITVTRRATPSPSPTPTPTPSPTPTPTPSPTPDPGPYQLTAALFPRAENDTWTYDVDVPGYPTATKVEKVGATVGVNGLGTSPITIGNDTTGSQIRFIRNDLTTGYGILQQQQKLSDGTIVVQDTYGQPLVTGYSLVKGQQGFTATAGGERASSAYIGPITVKFTASFRRSERVTVPAGTFDCAVIESVQETGYTLSGVFQTETVNRTEWRANGVGPVKVVEGTVTYSLRSANVGGQVWPQ